MVGARGSSQQGPGERSGAGGIGNLQPPEAWPKELRKKRTVGVSGQSLVAGVVLIRAGIGLWLLRYSPLPF